MLTQKYLKECLLYIPESGELVWKNRPETHFSCIGSFKSWNTRMAGTVAGSIKRTGTSLSYCQIYIDNKNYRVHRIIWLMAYGYFPSQIDHIDGNGMNNRLSNLREVTTQENSKNSAISKRNRSGVVGVSWDKNRRKWVASIGIQCNSVNLGRFSKKQDAIKARREAEILLGFHKNHGRKPTPQEIQQAKDYIN